MPQNLSQLIEKLPQKQMERAKKNAHPVDLSSIKRDWTGKTVRSLRVVTPVYRERRRTWWLCECRCGKVILVPYHALLKKQESCGCVNHSRFALANTKHGLAKTPIYKLWINIMQRCYNPKNPHYRNYGARGIRVSKPWHSFPMFYREFGQHRTGNQQVNRIDNEGHYSVTNCEWVSHAQNQQNKRTTTTYTVGDVTLSVGGWAKKVGMPYSTIKYRLSRGQTLQQAARIAPSQTL